MMLLVGLLLKRVFPERDKVHSPTASDFRSDALGEGEVELRL